MNEEKNRNLLNKGETWVESIIFGSRWIQMPMYLGLIFASVLYCWKFMVALYHMWHDIGAMTEQTLLATVLGLVDITMVANLIVMVIIGGYATFVSRLELEGNPDRPDWLNHINAGTLKVKLATSLATVSAVHLLQSFVSIKTHIDPQGTLWQQPIFWQLVTHVVFIVSSLLLAYTEQVMSRTHQASVRSHH